MESINNDYILKLFNLDNRKISSIEVHHQFDGVHVHVLLAVEPYRCPVCGTETSKLIHIHTRRLRIQFLAGYLASSIIRPDDISAPNAQRHSMSTIHLPLKA